MKFSLRGQKLGAILDHDTYRGAQFSMPQIGAPGSFSFFYTVYNGDRVGTSGSVLWRAAALNKVRFAADDSRASERNGHLPVDVPFIAVPDVETAGAWNRAPDTPPTISEPVREKNDSGALPGGVEAGSADDATKPKIVVGAIQDEPVGTSNNDTSADNAALAGDAPVDGLASNDVGDQHTPTDVAADTADADGADGHTSSDAGTVSSPEPDEIEADGVPIAVNDSATVAAPTNTTEAATGPARGFWLEHLAPITAKDSYTATHNMSLVVNAGSGVLANDYDPEGSALTVVHYDTTSARGGTIAMNPDGSFTYAPASNFSGADSFSYTATDGTHESPATVATFVYGPQPVQFESILENTPENSWVRVNLNQFQNVWVPREAINDNGNPSSIIAAWSSAAWDTTRNEYIFWGGGHANYGGNEVYTWSAVTLNWERASFPSKIQKIGTTSGGDWYETIDGPMHSPIASHTYDNQEFLVGADRMITFGGAAYNTGSAFVTSNGALTGPYLWDPSKADPNKVGGLDGSHVNPAVFPNITGGEMWENRHALQSTQPRPGLMLDGTTEYARIDGQDVVFVNDYSKRLFKYTMPDVSDPSKDTWQLVGDTFNPYHGTGSGTYDPHHNIYVRTAATSFLYWDLDRPGSRSVFFTPTDASGQFRLDGGMGMDYDPIRERYVIWKGDATIWHLNPPEALSASGWTIEKAPVSASPAPTIPNLFTGVLGKWDYIDQYDVFIGVNNAHTGDIWIYKPEGWSPAGFPPLQNNAVAGILESDAPPSTGNALTIEDVFSPPGGANHINTLAGDVDSAGGVNWLSTFATLLTSSDDSAASFSV